MNAQSNSLRNNGLKAVSFNFVTSSTNASTTALSTCITVSATKRKGEGNRAYFRNIDIPSCIPQVESLEENFERRSNVLEYRLPRRSTKAPSEQLKVTNHVLLCEMTLRKPKEAKQIPLQLTQAWALDTKGQTSKYVENRMGVGALDATRLAKMPISSTDPRAKVSKYSRKTFDNSEVPQNVGMASKTARRTAKASSIRDETPPKTHVKPGHDPT